jgi:hypothetical protein
MEPNFLTPFAALAIGLTTSLHCVAMCGPLACALRVNPLEYHGGRFVSYTIAGAVAGAFGQGLLLFLKGDTARIVPWVLAAVLLMIGLGLEKRLPQPQFLTAWLLRARLHRSLGLLTPLLPCGPLWLMLGAAAVTGAWTSGALLMASFIAGTIPLPLLLQSQAWRLRGRLSPAALRWTQQGVALISAGLLTWRAMLPANGSCH